MPPPDRGAVVANVRRPKPAARPTARPSARSDPASERIAVVDIGSNSIRLVVFDGRKRVPIPLFNEKVLCGLGRGLDETGLLNPEGVSLALESLARFVGLAHAMDVSDLELIATAAVRDARNGPEFVEEVEGASGLKIRVLSGEDEARLAALGVLSGTPAAQGLAGDLGGGSLELVELEKGKIGRGATLPLGPLRLKSAVDGDYRLAAEMIDYHLDSVPWLGRSAGATFYPVGGAWRSLARIHMDQAGYPLHMIHGYGLRRKDAEDLLRLLGHLGKRSLAQFRNVSRRRLETLPYAALLLERLLRRTLPERISFSAFGLREGWLFERLSERERRIDPLAAASSEWALRDGRFGDLGEEIADWCAPLFPTESESARRLRHAACHLADIGWRDHPDYRAEHSLIRVLHAQQIWLEHHERAYLAIALFYRYGGAGDSPGLRQALQLVRPKKAARAEALGAALRLAYALSGGAVEMLRRTKVVQAQGELLLTMPDGAAVPAGTTIEKRLQTLANALGVASSRLVL